MKVMTWTSPPLRSTSSMATGRGRENDAMAKGEERHGDLWARMCLQIPSVRSKKSEVRSKRRELIDYCRRDRTGTPHSRSSFPTSHPLARLILLLCLLLLGIIIARKRKKSKLGWLRTRANMRHERRGYVDRLRKGMSLLLFSLCIIYQGSQYSCMLYSLGQIEG